MTKMKYGLATKMVVYSVTIPKLQLLKIIFPIRLHLKLLLTIRLLRYLPYVLKDCSLITPKQIDLNPAILVDSPRPLTMHIGPDNSVWIGTLEGIYQFEYNFSNNQGKLVWSATNKVLGGSIFDIFSDNNGYIWYSNNNGIIRLNSKNKTYDTFDLLDGLQDLEFNQNSLFITDAGQIFIGGVNGVNSFYPSQISKNDFIPTLQLTGLNLYDASTSNDLFQDSTIHSLKELILTPKQKRFTVGFSALSYTTPEKNQYAYRLIGFDSTWTHSSSQERSATYSNLSPGSYILEVKGSNNDGIWNPVPTRLNIEVLPAFWQTTWFLILLCVTFALIVLGIFKAVISSMRRRHRMEQQLVESRQKALSAQMNPHFIFNSLNSIKNYMMNHQLKESETYLEKFFSVNANRIRKHF